MAPRLGYRIWIHVKPWDVCLGAAPKCGTSSIYKGLLDIFPEYVEERAISRHIHFTTKHIMALRPGEAYSVLGRRIWFIRHPWDRFTSLWRQKVRDGGYVEDKWAALFKGMTPEQLFEHIQHADNWHWDHQFKLAGLTEDVEFIRLDSLSGWWLEQTGKELPVQNPTQADGDEEFTEELRDWVMRWYRRDYKLWCTAT